MTTPETIARYRRMIANDPTLPGTEERMVAVELWEQNQEILDCIREADELARLICGSTPATPIKGRIESLAFHLAHHTVQFLNPTTKEPAE